MKTDNLTSSFLILRKKLHRSALKFLKNNEDAKDAVQESFLRLWENGKYKNDPEIQNKLFVILRNLCIDRLRKPPMFPLSDIKNDQLSSKYDVPTDLNEYESLITKGLTDFQKEIYNYLIKENLKYEEIASLLNMSVEAVRMNLCRIRKKIRENIKKYEL